MWKDNAYDLGVDSNADGSKMSHVTVEVDGNGYPVEIGESKDEKFVYVNEQACIGCTYCASTAPSTFFMEPENGRARVFQQLNDTESTIEEAMDTCPVTCISKISWEELVLSEIRRKGEVIDPYANLMSEGAGNVSNSAIGANKWKKQAASKV